VAPEDPALFRGRCFKRLRRARFRDLAIGTHRGRRSAFPPPHSMSSCCMNSCCVMTESECSNERPCCCGTIRRARKAHQSPLAGGEGLFCIFVFVYHVYNSSLGTLRGLSSSVSNFLFRPLQYGVELFFGLSGFFIVRTISRTPSVGHFAWDRFTRIYPFYG